MWHRVQFCLTDVSEPPIYRPCPDTFGNLLVILCRVPVVGVERTILIPLSNVAKLVHFIIHLSLQLKDSAGYKGEYQESLLSLHFFSSFSMQTP